MLSYHPLDSFGKYSPTVIGGDFQAPSGFFPPSASGRLLPPFPYECPLRPPSSFFLGAPIVQRLHADLPALICHRGLPPSVDALPSESPDSSVWVGSFFFSLDVEVWGSSRFPSLDSRSPDSAVLRVLLSESLSTCRLFVEFMESWSGERYPRVKCAAALPRALPLLRSLCDPSTEESQLLSTFGAH